ncbi:gel scht [Duganella callida]|uniref:Gel scht n=1 Tax=Duganella callida TaxID=2561932 RepID=A0A4Y9SEH7_9BURK|nr:gel scht [Duganella callida]TFW21528.1 gel scht [Duganella callida]
MKTILSGIAAALALTSVSLAHAQQSSVQIKSGHHYYLPPEYFYDFKNHYELDNGHRLSFTESLNRFYTQLDSGERVRIYPVSRTEFVSDSGARFEFRDDGETVVVDNFHQLTPAAMVMARR